MAYTQEDYELWASHRGRRDMEEHTLKSCTRIPAETGEVVIFVYHENGGFGRVTERYQGMVLNGDDASRSSGFDFTVGVIADTDMDALNAHMAEERAKREALLCKHPKVADRPGWACTSCGFASEETFGVPYECSCGDAWTVEPGEPTNCPTCSKFGAKQGQAQCPECGDVDTAEEVTLQACTKCGEVVGG